MTKKGPYMADQETPPEAGEAPAVTKQPYSPPQLLRHGTVEELTQGGINIVFLLDASTMALI
jgi:hypothetical protein